MHIPKGMTEEYVLEKIDSVARLLCRQYVFGYYDKDDLFQEMRYQALLAMPKYDPGGFDTDGNPNRKLENFLFTHFNNRLINLIRDKCRRNDPPCKICHENNQHLHEDGQICSKYAKWRARNDAKANLARPLDIGLIADEHERNMRCQANVEESAEVDEAIRMVDEKLPVEMRADYLRMRAGEKLTKARRLKIEETVKAILKDYLSDGLEDT